MFEHLKIKDWKQFAEVDIYFHPRLTIITGANGSGKSTIVRLLARHIGYPYREGATPRKDKITGKMSFFTRLITSFTLFPKIKTEEDLGTNIGTISYTNGRKNPIHVPVNADAQYDLMFSDMPPIRGVHIAANRPLFTYHAVSSIPARPKSKSQIFDSSHDASRTNAISGTGSRTSQIIKESLVCWATLGYESKHVESNLELQMLFEGFQEILIKVLPPQIGFRKFSIRRSEVVLVCDSGEFLLDSCSGGMSALIDIAWQIFTFQQSTSENKEFVVIIDEAENHLHANMQRNLLPSLLAAFPTAQFIVTTHSPFVVSSVKDSTVIALRFDSSHVLSESLDFGNLASPATDILRDILGVPTTLPIWAEKEIEETIQRFQNLPTTEENVNLLIKEMKDKKLENLIPSTLTSFANKKRGKN